MSEQIDGIRQLAEMPYSGIREEKEKIEPKNRTLEVGSSPQLEKLAILKAIEKTSDELPEVIYTINHYGDDIESTIRSRRINDIFPQDDILFPEEGQDSRLE